MRYFTYYWNKSQFLLNIAEGLEQGVALVDYTGGSGFRDRGVATGDLLYVITWYEGALRVLGRMQVDDVLDEPAAQRRVGDTYSASEHVVARAGTATPFVFDAEVNEEALDDIRFLTADGSTAPVKRNPAGKVEPQTFRNVREISASTADLFDEELGFHRTQAFAGDPIVRSVVVSVLVRDDDACEVEAAFEVRSSGAGVVPPRFVNIDHSTDDRTLLSDETRLTELVVALVGDWSSREGFAVDVHDLHAAMPMPVAGPGHLPPIVS